VKLQTEKTAAADASRGCYLRLRVEKEENRHCYTRKGGGRVSHSHRGGWGWDGMRAKGDSTQGSSPGTGGSGGGRSNERVACLSSSDTGTCVHVVSCCVCIASRLRLGYTGCYLEVDA